MEKNNDGFTLIELMIVVTIIAIILAIAIPNLLRSRMSANEASAISAVRAICTGEVGFQSAAFVDANADGIGDYGTLPQLANPDGGGAVPPFIDSVLSNGNKLGYTYRADVLLGDAANPPGFQAFAIPSTPGRTGIRQFFVDETGVLRVTSDGSAVGAGSQTL